MKTLTLDDIMLLPTCEDWPRERVAALMPACGYVTPIDVLNCADVPGSGAVWLIARMIPERNARLFACEVAERALNEAEKRGEKIDARSKNAITVSRRYASGDVTTDELSAACATAHAAAHSAAWSACAAAYAAAYDAAYWAAAHAAYDATCDDSYDSVLDSLNESRKLLLNYID